MFPDSPQHQSTEPANLPAVPITTQVQPSVPAGAGLVPQTTTATGTASARNVAQAMQLISQYGNDPYRLSEALSQLKSAYLADQYHITLSQAEN